MLYGNVYGSVVNNIMFTLMARDEFNEEDFYKLARKEMMPPEAISWGWRRYLLLFREAGYIERSESEGSWRATDA